MKTNTQPFYHLKQLCMPALYIMILLLPCGEAGRGFSQTFEWAKAMGGTMYDDGESITTDASGSVYITGSFVDTVDFDPGGGTYNLASAGYNDIFVQKLDTAGNFIWAKAMGGTSLDIGLSITTDAFGNVYITGYFEGTVDFDPGAGTFNLTSVLDDNFFVLKLDAAGNFAWAKTMDGGVSNDNSRSITTASGNVYNTGSFRGTADFDPGAGTYNLTSAGDDDIFVQKFDAVGNFTWAKPMGGAGYDVGKSITTDASGNVYITGYFSDTVDFDPGAGTFNLSSAGSQDIFVLKLDAAGNFLWTKAMGGTGWDESNSIITDAFGNVYITGNFSGTVDFDPGAGTFNLSSAGSQDIFVLKLDAAGNFLWTKAMGGPDWDEGKSITTDASGNVYITGNFNGKVDFDPGAGTFSLTSAGGRDIFVLKLSIP